MSSIQEQGLELFKSGYNCAQSVLTAYSEKLGFDRSFGLMAALGFGGGMGRLQDTCGAVTGAFMVLSIYNCKKYSDNLARKDNTYSMIQYFNEEFKEINGTTNCFALTGCDLKTAEGQALAKEKNIAANICAKCVSDALKILDEMI